MNKPFVALLVALTVMATVNMVIATGPMIQKVFVTNFPQNQNVTVTNPPAPPTVNVNVTASKPSLNVTLVKDEGVLSCALPSTGSWDWAMVGKCSPGLEVSVKVSGYKNVHLFVSAPVYDYINTTNNGTVETYNYSYHVLGVKLGYGPLAGLDKAFETEFTAYTKTYSYNIFNYTSPSSRYTNSTYQAPGGYVYQYEAQPNAPTLYVRFYVLHAQATGSYNWVTSQSTSSWSYFVDTSTIITASVYAVD